MESSIFEEWEPVIGLEIHVQLSTLSKLFSPAPNRFGNEPNINISHICTAQPGSLPLLNKEAVYKAVQLGLAIDAEISLRSEFDRKSYFYPDNPRNYQITQFYHPLIQGGEVEVDVGGKPKVFKIRSAHLEDDAGMIKHFNSYAGIDFNRAGVPLIEIVTEPCFHSAEEACLFAQEVRSILEYLDVSDCNMEEGSLRIDANISVRKKGDAQLRQRVEIKNMNSFSNMELAIKAEFFRQVRLYVNHGENQQENLVKGGTYRFDPDKNEIVMMRLKDSVEDYRYFPEPDLLPLLLSEEYIEEVRKALPELPREKKLRYIETLNLTPYAAKVLIADRKLCQFFEETLKLCPYPRALCNWITIEFVGRFKENGTSFTTSGISPESVANLVSMIENKEITGKIAKMVADDMVKNPGLDSREIVRSNPDYKTLNDDRLIEKIIDTILENNPSSIEDYRNGKTKAFDYLIGKVMAECKGQADPVFIRDHLLKKLNAGTDK